MGYAYYVIYCIFVPIFMNYPFLRLFYSCPCHMIVNWILILTRCLSIFRVLDISLGRDGRNGLESSHSLGYLWSHNFGLGHVGKVGMVMLESWFCGLGGRIGPRERSLGGIVHLNRLRTVHGWPQFWASYRATTYPKSWWGWAHYLLWLGHWCTVPDAWPRGYIERLRGVPDGPRWLSA